MVHARIIFSTRLVLRSTALLPLFRIYSTEAFSATSSSSMATIAKPEMIREALQLFLPEPDKAIVTQTSSGVNNVVQYVHVPAGTSNEKDDQELILRIYNNGCNTEAVQYEHAILESIDRTMLPFQVPQYIPSKNGVTMEPLQSGTQCCMCYRIPGILPKTSDPKPLGRATGQLMMAMAQIKLEQLIPPIAPYYRIYHVHKGIGGDKDIFYSYCKGPEFDSCREGITTLCNTLLQMEDTIASYLKDNLPQHIIHGDLHYDNVLTDPQTGTVTGLLDFEFCTMDWRAMEVAVCLSKYVGEDDPFPLVESFIDGFCEYGTLTEQECYAIPDMINLRVLSNCVYFVGRAITGQDTITTLTSRANMYAQRVLWVKDNKDRISDCIISRMKAKGVF